MRVIVCCECPRIPSFAKDSFRIMFQKESLPQSYIGDSEIAKLRERALPGSDFDKYLQALQHNKEKFAYFIEESDGYITRMYDLRTGRRVA